jgi:hypothetical protein
MVLLMKPWAATTVPDPSSRCRHRLTRLTSVLSLSFCPCRCWVLSPILLLHPGDVWSIGDDDEVLTVFVVSFILPERPAAIGLVEHDLDVVLAIAVPFVAPGRTSCRRRRKSRDGRPGIARTTPHERIDIIRRGGPLRNLTLHGRCGLASIAVLVGPIAGRVNPGYGVAPS